MNRQLRILYVGIRHHSGLAGGYLNDHLLFEQCDGLVKQLKRLKKEYPEVSGQFWQLIGETRYPSICLFPPRDGGDDFFHQRQQALMDILEYAASGIFDLAYRSQLLEVLDIIRKVTDSLLKPKKPPWVLPALTYDGPLFETRLGRPRHELTLVVSN